MRERLQKYLASCGLASRRKCEELISQGRVSVNGAAIRQLGTCVDPAKDVIVVDGREIKSAGPFVYYALNKPEGIVVTVSDSHGAPTVMDILQGVPERVFPVGRLDRDTEGLLLLTNDGELAHRLMHPRYHLEKEYLVTVSREVKEHNLHWLRKGIPLEGRVTKPAEISIFRKERRHVRYKVVISEGRKRQIRQMFKTVGHPVLALKRVAIGPIRLGMLPLGQYRSLNQKEIRLLREATGLMENKRRIPKGGRTRDHERDQRHQAGDQRAGSGDRQAPRKTRRPFKRNWSQEGRG